MTPVPEILALKYENLSLKLQGLQWQMQQLQQMGQTLTKEREDLLTTMRHEVGAGPSDPYNPQTRLFQSTPKPPLSTPPSRQAKRAGKIA